MLQAISSQSLTAPPPEHVDRLFLCQLEWVTNDTSMSTVRNQISCHMNKGYLFILFSDMSTHFSMFFKKCEKALA